MKWVVRIILDSPLLATCACAGASIVVPLVGSRWSRGVPFSLSLLYTPFLETESWRLGGGHEDLEGISDLTVNNLAHCLNVSGNLTTHPVPVKALGTAGTHDTMIAQVISPRAHNETGAKVYAESPEYAY